MTNTKTEMKTHNTMPIGENAMQKPTEPTLPSQTEINLEQIKMAKNLIKEIMRVSFDSIKEDGNNTGYVIINRYAKNISDILEYKINSEP